VFRTLFALSVVFPFGLAMAASAALGLPPVPVSPANPQSAEKAALGKKLFFDTRFSKDGSISCASCHIPQKAFTDGNPVGVGVKGLKGTRNTPTVINAVYYQKSFWDGRRDSLEQQALDPLTNPVEHGLGKLVDAIAVIKSSESYVNDFSRVFAVDNDGITPDHVGKAIAAYERTLIAGNSAFDRYQYGGDTAALSASARRGLELFRGKGLCVTCHLIGPKNATFTDNQFHNIGVGLSEIESRASEIISVFLEARLAGTTVDNKVLSDKEASHLGRFAVTLNPADFGNFRTPDLRNVALTAPYMHDGSLKTLDEVVEFYGRGGSLKDGVRNMLQHPSIKDLNLSRTEQKDLVEFMKSLTSETLPQ